MEGYGKTGAEMRKICEGLEKDAGIRRTLPDVMAGLKVCGTLLEDGVSVDCGECPYFREDGSECDRMAREAMALL